MFFFIAGIIAMAFVFSFFYPILFPITQLFLICFILITILDCIVLISNKNGIDLTRKISEKMSNFEESTVDILVQNKYLFPINIEIYEELPFQLNHRKMVLKSFLPKKSTKRISYIIKPTERGEYLFGFSNVFIKSPINLLSRKKIIKKENLVKVYPTYLNLSKYDLHSLHTIQEFGVKKVRKLGHSMEFEQIKEYVQGDDIRTLNWKATAKRNNLMVNQFSDEKSQQIYTVIDTGRMMKMPFNGLSLLDYSINSALVILNIVLKNHDKAGMFTFNKNINHFISADKKTMQMQRILDNLYSIKPEYLETDFSRLFAIMKSKVSTRSLIFLFTNFETLDSLYRQLPYLRSINKTHVLVTIFFKNIELENYLKNTPQTEFDLYQKTLVEKSIYEKRLIVKELNSHGIQTILTSPDDLTISVINKYLEIKAKSLV